MAVRLATLEAAVDSAFAAAGELVKTATFSREGVTGFDWTTQELSKTDPDEVSVQVILYQTSQTDSTVTTQALVRARDFPGELYDLLLVDGVMYGISDFTVHPAVVELSLRSN